MITEQISKGAWEMGQFVFEQTEWQEQMEGNANYRNKNH